MAVPDSGCGPVVTHSIVRIKEKGKILLRGLETCLKLVLVIEMAKCHDVFICLLIKC